MATLQTDIATNYPRNSIATVGKSLRSVAASKTLSNGSPAIGDIIQLGGPFTVKDRIAGILGINPGFTAVTSADLGFYVKNTDGTLSPYSTAAAIVLWSAQNLVTATAYVDLLFNYNAALSRWKTIGDLLSLNADQEVPNGLYLGLRTNVANTSTNTFNWEIKVEEATTN